MEENKLIVSIIEGTQYHLIENLAKIKECVSILDSQKKTEHTEGTWTPIVNQILHLEGNLRQWVLHGIFNEKDVRIRSKEFESSKIKLQDAYESLESTIHEISEKVLSLGLKKLLEVNIVQAYDFNGVRKILHVLEHCSYHVGQIVLLTKQNSSDHIDFYPEVK